MTDQARLSSCAVHTGSGRGTETGYVAIEAMRVIRLFRRVGQQHRFGGVVGDAGGLEILDLRVHPVALADAGETRAAVARLGVGPAGPQLDAPGPAGRG